MNTSKDILSAAIAVLCLIALIMVLTLTCGCDKSGTGSDTELPEFTVGEAVFQHQWHDWSGECHNATTYNGRHRLGKPRVVEALNDPLLLCIMQRARNGGHFGDRFVLSEISTKVTVTQSVVDGESHPTEVALIVFEEDTGNDDQSYAVFRRTVIEGVEITAEFFKIYRGDDPWRCWTRDESSRVRLLAYGSGGTVHGQLFGKTTIWVTARFQLVPMGPTVDPTRDLGSFVECVAVGSGTAAIVCAFNGSADYGDCVDSGVQETILHCATAEISSWF